jgi:putative hemolysin
MTVFLVLCFVFLLILSAFFSASETAFTTLTPFQLDILSKEGGKSSKRVVFLSQKTDHVVSTILVGNTIANIGASSISTVLAINFFGDASVGYVTGLLTLIVLVFGEITPKQFALVHNKVVARFVSWPLLFFQYFLKPVTLLVSSVSYLINLLFGSREHVPFSIDQIFYLVRKGEDHGMVEAYEKEVVHNVFRLTELSVSHIMTHRKDVFSLPSHITLSDASETLMHHDFSRIPIYDGSLENIVGILLLRDFFKAILANKAHMPVSQLMLKPIFVPSGLKIKEMVDVFKQETLNMAVVMDEYGGLAGVVTQEDVLEEIFGELYDENDALEQTPLATHDGWILPGDTPIYWLESMTNENIIHDKSVNTVGGYLTEQLGRVPYTGETLNLPFGKFIINVIKEHRVSQLYFYPNKQSGGDNDL